MPLASFGRGFRHLRARSAKDVARRCGDGYIVVPKYAMEFAADVGVCVPSPMIVFTQLGKPLGH